MILRGDCLERMRELEEGTVDLVYLDPPFFTQKVQRLTTRGSNIEYSFGDVWKDAQEYKKFIRERVLECRRLLKATGSLFLHCSREASHHLRMVLDETFGSDNFQSEIIWKYRRWSNAKKGLLNAHQTIYFYSRTPEFKFKTIFAEYSPTTNIDQILQKRQRTGNGKAAYKRSENGEIEFGGVKRGVPLTDVWDLPYLNPKAAERTGYPTQKPIHLMERIIELTTDAQDLVLDPFCGSGTTLVAAKLLNRRYVGIDQSEEAVGLTNARLSKPIKSPSHLLRQGDAAYLNQDPDIGRLLATIGAVVVQRNGGIDGFLGTEYVGKNVPVRVQRRWETLGQARNALMSACEDNGCSKKVLIVTNPESGDLIDDVGKNDSGLIMLDSLDLSIKRALSGEVATNISERQASISFVNAR